MQRNLFRALLALVPGALMLSGCNTIPAASLAQTAPYQGTYAGGATINDPALPSNVCQSQIKFDGFTVSGTEVRFGEFRGTIHEDGSIQMNVGATWINGRFVPPANFVGQLLLPPVDICVYRVALGLQS
jgi:hypothetical protein